MGKRLLALVALAVATRCSLWAGDGLPVSPFGVPFDFPLTLSGNFGELRSNHFHGGLDFKTQGVVGKPIRCIADGYISRASVAPGGYGNALYVTHPNGYTSVYGHLEAFPAALADTIRQHQYANETFPVDLTFGEGEFPVVKGEVLALAGNTGYSFGPHLHMEIRETATNEPVDPLLFYARNIKDTTAPRATAVMLYPMRGEGVVAGATVKRRYAFGQGRTLAQPIEAWGVIGAGIAANDYMDGTANNYGVCSVTLKVDGREVFNSTVDRFLFNENRLINSWTDYEEYRSRGKWYMKSYIEPGNPLRMLRAFDNRGLVTIDQERDYRFEYTLADFHGNRSTYSFVVRGVARDIPTFRPAGNHYLAFDKANIVAEPGMELVIPRGMLYADADVKVVARPDTAVRSHRYLFEGDYVPFHDFCPLAIGVTDTAEVDIEKLYVAVRRKGKTASAGGVYENGWMKTQIRDLSHSEYFVAVDTIPPKVTPQAEQQWGKRGTITFKIGDSQTGVKSYRGTVDGAFVLFEFSSKTLRLTCRLDETPVKRGKRHTLQLVVTDYCGNETLIEKEFNY